MCVRILAYVCPHTMRILHVCPHTTIYVSAYYYMCVLILLCMCPHTTTCVSSYCYMCVLMILSVCPHTAIRDLCVRILLCVSSYCYMCPHDTICVSSYCCMALRAGPNLLLTFYFTTQYFTTGRGEQRASSSKEARESKERALGRVLMYLLY